MLLRKLSTSLGMAALCLVVSAASGCGGAETRKARHLEKGQTFLAAGNFEKARIEFQNVLQIAPKDPQARFQMGVVDEKLAKPREAAQYYQSTIDVDPNHLGARINLARLYLFSGAADKALELIAPAIEQHPDDAELLTVRAAARIQKKDRTAAVADAERAVQLAPSNEDAVSVLAGAYLAEGNKAKAQALLEQSMEKNPTSWDLRLMLAQIYIQGGRPADAEALLIKIVALQPAEKSHRLRLAQFYAQTNQIDAGEGVLRQAIKDLPGERDIKFSLIDFLSARRDRDTAEKELKAMIAAAPADNDLKFGLGKFYEEGHDLTQAEALYKGVIEKEKLGPAGLSARDQLAKLRLQMNDVAGALALAQEVLAKSPRDDEALILRGNIALSKQDPRSAIADLRAVLRDEPNAVGVLRSLARAHLANGEPAIAEETLHHAVEANPKNPLLRLDYAQLLAQLGKPEQAKPIVVDLVKQNPSNLEALDTAFKVSAALKDYATAKSAADAIVALRPKLASGYLYEGMLAEEGKRPEDALRLYASAVDLKADSPEPLEAEIRLLMNLKRVPEAIKRLDAFAARYPQDSFALNIKGNVLLANGRHAEAQEAFKQAIARNPKWWVPYRDLAKAQLEMKQDPAAAVATLRDGKKTADQKDVLCVEIATLVERIGKPDEAITEYEEVLGRDPRSEVAANNLAMLLATYKKDAASLDRAKELTARFSESVNPSFLDTYGWVLYKRGEAAASVPVLERVVAKVPDQAVARYHLGMAQSLAGDNTDARDNLTRAIKSGVKFSGLDEAKATLEKLATLPAALAATPKT